MRADGEAENERTIEGPGRAHPRGSGARFLPGTILDGRYRVVAPLGQGGMGEVYRAEDLKLGQPVALKFLPAAVERDPGRMVLLLDEVRLARQVSHPNVCRVWDVGESDGLHFIAMEYVDGENLDSLLQRIGRLPEERAVRVAREMCAGLAAVHDQGLLHRDLKPANVMLDGRGRVRITDFGLAALAGSVTRAEVGHGTPAYMAPEQRAGREVTAQSDVYALGLVLHEIFTGKHATASGGPPSSHLGALDPVIEQAILRCLETDPAARPSSALAVARALPGGDPLGVALAAGETPSPEMVAAAGGAGGLRPVVAWGLVALALAGSVGLLLLSERRGLPFTAETRPYAALQDRAEEFAKSVGGPPRDGEMRDGFSRAGSDADYFYWHRRSPAAIAWVDDDDRDISPFARPPLEAPGEIAQRYDLRGRLIEFRRLPGDSATAGAAPGLSAYFTAAGLSDSALVPAQPTAPAPVPAQAHHAWTVTAQGRTVPVEAATHGGEVTYFRAGDPYTVAPLERGQVQEGTLASIVAIALFLVTAFFAQRNLRAGRADLRGAFRLSLVSAVCGYLGWGLLAQPQVVLGGGLFNGFATSLFFVLFQAASYLALEPLVRRRHPEWLTSWTRLLDGRWRDPLVGRDVLLGAVGGIAVALLGTLRLQLGNDAGSGDYQAAAVGGWTALAVVLRALGGGGLIAFVYALVLVLLQMVTRSERIGWLLWWLLAGLVPVVWQFTLPAFALELASTAVFGLLLVRAGLVGVFIAAFVFAAFNAEYLTTELGAWYSGVTVAALLSLAVLLGWGVVAATRRTTMGAAAAGRA